MKMVLLLFAPENKEYLNFDVPDYRTKCKATESDLGYYVVYDDGYKSWSPAKAFEEGYTKI